MNQDDDGIPKIKLIAVGGSGVGKSSILTRFTSDKFDEFSEPTLGAAFIPKKFTLPDGRVIEFHVKLNLHFSCGIQLVRRNISQSLQSTIVKLVSLFVSTIYVHKNPLK